jgi:hypothetical protein
MTGRGRQNCIQASMAEFLSCADNCRGMKWEMLKDEKMTPLMTPLDLLPILCAIIFDPVQSWMRWKSCRLGLFSLPCTCFCKYGSCSEHWEHMNNSWEWHQSDRDTFRRQSHPTPMSWALSGVAGQAQRNLKRPWVTFNHQHQWRKHLMGPRGPPVKPSWNLRTQDTLWSLPDLTIPKALGQGGIIMLGHGLGIYPSYSLLSPCKWWDVCLANIQERRFLGMATMMSWVWSHHSRILKKSQNGVVWRKGMSAWHGEYFIHVEQGTNVSVMS